jgi:hypothetical protein
MVECYRTPLPTSPSPSATRRGVESRVGVGGCEVRPLAPVSDQITASDDTDDTDVRRARGSKQAAGGRRQAGSQACAQQSERTRVLLPAGTEGSWQLAAGTRRWELGGGRGSAGRRLAIVTQTGYALSSPLSLQARRYPARTWRRPALLRHAQSVHGASVITY